MFRSLIVRLLKQLGYGIYPLSWPSPFQGFPAPEGPILDKGWLELFFSIEELHPNRKGHGSCPSGPPHFGGKVDYDQRPDIERMNLGLGWLYYALMRMYKVSEAVCIGSERGFVPLLLAKGIKDNGGGTLHFIDPSFWDDFWKNPQHVATWFESFGVGDVITHYLMTTEQFAKTPPYQRLTDIEFLFVDGGHRYENVKFDFEVFKEKMAAPGLIAFHDSYARTPNPHRQEILKLMKEIADLDEYQMFDFKLGGGLTLIQRYTLVQSPDYVDMLAAQWGDRDPTEWW